MRMKLNRQFKVLLVFFIIVGAFGYARMSTMNKDKSMSSDVSKQAEREYRKAGHYVKKNISFLTEDIQSTQDTFNQLITTYNLNVLKKGTTNNNLSMLAEIEALKLNPFLNDIRNMKSDGEKLEDTDNNTDVFKDLQQRLDINIALKNKYMADLQKKDQLYSSDRINEQLNTVQMTIDSLKSEMQQQDRNKNFSLVLINVKTKTSPMKDMMFSTGSFATRFILALLGLTIFVIILLFVINGILALLSLLGFHTSKNSSKSYGSYRYQSKSSYQYENRKRKVKRIYKDPNKHHENEEINNNKD